MSLPPLKVDQPTEPETVNGVCKACDGDTFHALVHMPPPGELARQMVALECTGCGLQISLHHGEAPA